MITQVQPGSYRTPLVAGLRQLGNEHVANHVANGRVKIGTASQMRSIDVTLPDLSPLFQHALKQSRAKDEASEAVLSHYVAGLESGTMVPAYPGGRSGGQEHYAPGELFLRS